MRYFKKNCLIFHAKAMSGYYVCFTGLFEPIDVLKTEETHIPVCTSFIRQCYIMYRLYVVSSMQL